MYAAVFAFVHSDRLPALPAAFEKRTGKGFAYFIYITQEFCLLLHLIRKIGFYGKFF